jgi:hypothetical protein
MIFVSLRAHNGGAKLRGGLARDAPLTASVSAQPPRYNRGDSRVSLSDGLGSLSWTARPPPAESLPKTATFSRRHAHAGTSAFRIDVARSTTPTAKPAWLAHPTGLDLPTTRPSSPPRPPCLEGFSDPLRCPRYLTLFQAPTDPPPTLADDDLLSPSSSLPHYTAHRPRICKTPTSLIHLKRSGTSRRTRRASPLPCAAHPSRLRQRDPFQHHLPIRHPPCPSPPSPGHPQSAHRRCQPATST